MWLYNQNIPTSHDANHAIISNLETDLNHVLSQIDQFYTKKGIEPRICPAYIYNEFRITQPYFEKHGFVTHQFKNWVAVLRNQSKIQDVDGLRAQRIKQMNEDLAARIVETEGNDRIVRVLERVLKHKNYLLFCGFVDMKPVSFASLTIYWEYNRVNDVLTSTKYRGKGYCSTVINCLCRVHNKISSNILYHWADGPIAIKIYQKAGFEEVKEKYDFQFWSAHKCI